MLRLAVLMWALIGTTLAGSFILAVVSIPSLAEQGMRLVPIAGIAGFVVAIPLARSSRAASSGAAAGLTAAPPDPLHPRSPDKDEASWPTAKPSSRPALRGPQEGLSAGRPRHGSAGSSGRC